MSRAHKPMQALAAAALALSLSACPAAPPVPEDLPATAVDLAAPGDAAAPPDLSEDPSADVQGTAVDTHLLGDGERAVPRDLSKIPIAALVLSGPGGFTSYPGAGQADGTFRVPRVPMGTYYLKLGDEYVVTSARRLDLGRSRLGRPDLAVATTRPTAMTFNLKGLSPYQGGDFIELFAPSAHAYIFGVEYYGDQGVAVGDTEVKDLTIDYLDASTGERPYLINGDQGDRALLWQMVSKRDLAGVGYQALGRVLRPAAFAQRDGQEVQISGTFEDVPQDQSLKLSWRRAAFEALRGSLVPGTSATDSASVTLFAEPGGKAHGVTAGYGDLVFGPQGRGPGDVESGVLSYGNPFPATWTQIAHASIASSTSYTVGAARRMLLNARLSYYAEKDEFVRDGGRPSVGPPRAPRVADKDVFTAAPVSGVGGSPRLTWSEPALGPAAGYVVSLIRLSAVDGRTVGTTIATFFVSETGQAADRALTLPPGLLVSGELYHLRLRAVAGPGADLSRAPFRQSLPWGSADALTAPFSL